MVPLIKVSADELLPMGQIAMYSDPDPGLLHEKSHSVVRHRLKNN